MKKVIECNMKLNFRVNFVVFVFLGWNIVINFLGIDF